MRVVFDTSVWVSALLWTGLPNQILKRAEAGDIIPIMSPALLDELRDVLIRPKFEPTIKARNTNVPELIAGVLSLVEFFDAPLLLGIVPDDPDDDAVVSCAVAGLANWIITGDAHLLNLGKYQGVNIETPKGFTDKNPVL